MIGKDKICFNFALLRTELGFANRRAREGKTSKTDYLRGLIQKDMAAYTGKLPRAVPPPQKRGVKKAKRVRKPAAKKIATKVAT